MGKKFRSRTIFTLLKYTATTLLGTLVDLAAVFILSKYVFQEETDLNATICSAIAFECAVMVNFFTAFFIVWSDRLEGKTVKSYFSHLWKYNLSCLSACAVKLLLFYPLKRFTPWDPVLCELCALTISGFVNFGINEKIIFKKRPENTQVTFGQNMPPKFDPEELEEE